MQAQSLALQIVHRSIADTLYFSCVQAALMAVSKPGLALRFLKLRRRTETFQYGPHPSHRLEIVSAVVADRSSSSDSTPPHPARTLVFVHGGAWGSGKPWMYRLLADRLSTVGYTVVLIGYRTWPDGTTDDQVCSH
jgi:acetyl esterase/lipase